ncbi:MAG: (d)CMP kinase [Verrucomicrobiales bacterium]
MTFNRHTVIAIDGPAASGKSTVARLLALRLGYGFVNSGALYRAMTLAMVRANVAVQQSEAVAAAVPAARLTSGLEDHSSWVAIGGPRLQNELETGEVNAAVSFVAKVPEVRAEVVRQLRAFAELCPIVMEGRDIGSVVFPDTPWKFYVDASEEVRQSRRAAQGLVDSVRDRDRVDSSRANAPLMVADGAVIIDSDELSPNGVVDAIIGLMKAKAFQIPTVP